MARSAQEIFDTMLAAKNADPNLSGLTSQSQTAIWRLWLWVFAKASETLEALLDTQKANLAQMAREAQVGNVLWYRNRILEFQFGDALVLVGEKYVYAIINEAKKIVKRCVVEDTPDGVLRLKVAKIDGQNLTALDANEVNALISYVKKIRFAGVKFQVFTNNGDQLRIFFDIYFDPIIPLSIVRENVEATIKNYVTNLPFDGDLVVTNLIDQIQKIEGVKDVFFKSGAYRFTDLDTYISFNRIAKPIGGHFRISNVQGESLSDSITYISI